MITRFNSILIKLIEAYRQSNYELFASNLQQIGYLVSEVDGGKIRFVKGEMGPYSEDLLKIVEKLQDWSWISGGDGVDASVGSKASQVLVEADAFLTEDADATARLAQVKSLIEGFETPYGMELLASVHWVANHEAANDMDAAVAKVQAWNARKAKLMQPKHIHKAFERLQTQAWL